MTGRAPVARVHPMENVEPQAPRIGDEPGSSAGRRLFAPLTEPVDVLTTVQPRVSSPDVASAMSSAMDARADDPAHPAVDVRDDVSDAGL